ncbi:MAG: SGNH/GDSL hydrolase family protein [Polyangiaceae bacterium]|nr:SGNH/GDSL hydrolase family protein [Polyangiaceae bacterium]
MREKVRSLAPALLALLLLLLLLPPVGVPVVEAQEPTGRRVGDDGQIPTPAHRARYVVAAVGDSLTDVRSHGGRFLTYLQARCPESRFDNYGKGGDMVNQMRRRFAANVLAAGKPRYTHVIVFGGVNDLYSDLTAKRTPEKIERDLSTMYAQARERGIRVIAMTVAPWGGFTRYYNAGRGANTLLVNRWIHDQKTGGEVDFVIDAYALLSCGDAERLCPQYSAPFKDGLHFNALGHSRLGEALYAQVFRNCR